MSTATWGENGTSRIHKRIESDQEVFFISDLHLGDGSSSDSFQGKDQELIAFLQHVQEKKAHLVIVGDAIDFHQAWFFSRVLKAHTELFGALSSLAATSGVTYIWGNHDADISFFKDILRFEVCSSLEVGDKALVLHGYEYDPFIGPNLEETHQATRIHHLIERALSSWIRLPLEHFYTLPNRIVFWLFHKLVLLKNFVGRFVFKRWIASLTPHEMYWVHGQMGDPQGIFEQVRSALENGSHQWIVTGHSHMPGQVEVAPNRWYINTGSWTFKSSTYAHWNGSDFQVRDWIKGKRHGDRWYLPLVERRWRHMDMTAWWRANYMGWLRFRVGEVGKAPSIRRLNQDAVTHPPPKE